MDFRIQAEDQAGELSHTAAKGLDANPLESLEHFKIKLKSKRIEKEDSIKYIIT